MKFLVPQGIGDSIWALFKAQDIANKLGDGVVELRVAVWHQDSPAETRAIEFLKRFACVQSVAPYVMPREDDEGHPLAGAVSLPGPAADAHGYYRYLPDGPPDQFSGPYAETGIERYPGIDYVLMPNAPLERGIRLEDWLPEFKTDWDLMKQFRWTAEEVAWMFDTAPRFGPYVVFFMGSLGSNTTAGHNRGPLWTAQEWYELGERMHAEQGYQIIIVGADYDLDYASEFIKKIEGRLHWHPRVGLYDIGRTFAACMRSKVVVSYQSGIGIVSSYLGKPTAIFWRPKGDSISPDQYVSFEESMATAWANPQHVQDGRLFPAIYGRHGVQDIFNWSRLW